MNTRVRLESISSSLANSFHHSTEAQQRRAVWAACSAAVSQAGLQGGDVELALELLHYADGGDRAAVRNKLIKYSEQLDEQYFSLYEEAEEEMTPAALRYFRQARAASALALGLSSNSNELHEAIYEALIASDRRAETLQAADMQLR